MDRQLSSLLTQRLEKLQNIHEIHVAQLRQFQDSLLTELGALAESHKEAFRKKVPPELTKSPPSFELKSSWSSTSTTQLSAEYDQPTQQPERQHMQQERMVAESPGQATKRNSGIRATLEVPAAFKHWLQAKSSESMGEADGPEKNAMDARSENSKSVYGSGGASPVLDVIWADLARNCETVAGRDRSTRDLSASSASVFGDLNAYRQTVVQQRADFIGIYESTEASIKWSFQDFREVFHPYSRFRLCWDCLGLLFVLFDIILIPIDFAWDRKKNQAESTLTLVILLYWILDILLTFNTGFTRNGALVTGRLAIAKHYALGRLSFDVLLVALDLVIVLMSNTFLNMFRFMRGIRVLRAVRIFRALKKKKFLQYIENWLFACGSGWIVLSATIVKTLLFILLSAHCIGCMWYLLGKMEKERGEANWLERITRDSEQSHLIEDMGDSYTISLHWVLSHLTAAPSDDNISPQNEYERIFAMCNIVASLLILGTAIGKITNTMDELNKMESEFADSRRELRRYFSDMGTSIELSSRVLEFVTESYKKRNTSPPSNAIMGLLSESLSAELVLAHRGPYFVAHPLFMLVSLNFGKVYVKVCETFTASTFAANDVVFHEDTWSSCFHVTAGGGVVLEDSASAYRTFFTESRWFSEVCLFARSLHRSTLKATEFANAYSMSGSDVAECVQMSPACTAIVVKYATCFLKLLWEGMANTCPEGKYLVADVLPVEVSLKACRAATEIEEIGADLVAAPVASREATEKLMAGIHNGTLENEEALNELQCVLGELDRNEGLYQQATELDEQKRVTCALMSVVWLLGNRYHEFTQNQMSHKRMSPALWQEFQVFVHDANLSSEALHVLMVFLTIRGLGKSKTLAKRLGLPQSATPQQVLETLLRKGLISSVQNLDSGGEDLLRYMIRIHEIFNLSQFLQLENAPHHIQVLADCIEEVGEFPFKCYLIALVAMMSGLLATRNMDGSLFMDEQNGRNVLDGIKCLQHVGTASPAAIYWHYVEKRAHRISLPMQTPEHLAIARLACLNRTTTSQVPDLRTAWRKLSRLEQSVLIEWCLADGVSQSAEVFVFLPKYLEEANKNAAVGLSLALRILAIVVDQRRRTRLHCDCPDLLEEINLFDLASFTGKVRSQEVFQMVPMRSEIVEKSSACYDLVLANELWDQVDQLCRSKYATLEDVAYSISRFERETLSFQQVMASSLTSQKTSSKEVPQQTAPTCDQESNTMWL